MRYIERLLKVWLCTLLRWMADRAAAAAVRNSLLTAAASSKL
jgi:hypothetical protein